MSIQCMQQDGICHRCGAPMAPLMLSGGAMCIACTRCSTKEDQDAQREMQELAWRAAEGEH